MVTEHFGSAIGSKFNEDGSFRYFPGNTMISKLDSSPIFGELCRLQNELLDEGRREFVIPLPSPSFHMTVFEGVCSDVRDKAHWSGLCSTDEDLSVVSSLLYSRFKCVKQFSSVVMRLSYLRMDTGISIGLETLDRESEREIREYRDRLSDALEIRFPNHDSYRFHIGLAYGFKGAGDRDALFSELQERLNRRFNEREILFQVPPASYCIFNDMSYFKTYEGI